MYVPTLAHLSDRGRSHKTDDTEETTAQASNVVEIAKVFRAKIDTEPANEIAGKGTPKSYAYYPKKIGFEQNRPEIEGAGGSKYLPEQETMKNNEESCSDILTGWALADFFGELRELKIDALLTRGIDFVTYGLIGLSWEFRRTQIGMQGHRIVTFNV